MQNFNPLKNNNVIKNKNIKRSSILNEILLNYTEKLIIKCIYSHYLTVLFFSIIFDMIFNKMHFTQTSFYEIIDNNLLLLFYS